MFMPKKRYIDFLTIKERIATVISAISFVSADYLSEDKKNTSFKKYMTHYLGSKWKVSDIEQIENMTLKEIIELYEK